MASAPVTMATVGPAASPRAPRVSVIIPHYNDLGNLSHCIELLRRQTLAKNAFEVVVADNNSRCGIEEVRRVCGDFARVVPAPIQGAAAARNAAVAASRGAILAFIDSDCRPSPNWLERGVAALSASALVGGRVDVDCADPMRPTAVEAFERVYAFDVKRYVKEVGFAVSANMFAPRNTFDRVGGFRPKVAEDFDWGRRAVEAGYSWTYGDDVIVSHPARRTWADLIRKWRRLNREAYEGTIEKPNGRLKWVLRNFAVLASPFVHWTAAVRSDKVNGLAQRLNAVRVLFLLRFWRFYDSWRLLLRS